MTKYNDYLPANCRIIAGSTGQPFVGRFPLRHSTRYSLPSSNVLSGGKSTIHRVGTMLNAPLSLPFVQVTKADFILTKVNESRVSE